jgi:hypothetical protein
MEEDREREEARAKKEEEGNSSKTCFQKSVAREDENCEQYFK